MIEAELVEDGGVDVVDVRFVDGGVVADFIGLAVADAALDASAGHPGGEAMGVVVTARFCGFLREGESSELAAPDDEGVI